jgi:hypothetical protein
MSRISNSHNVSVVAAGTSALATTAAAMSSGSWASFTMGNMNGTLVQVGGGHNCIEFCARGHWDNGHKKIQFWGQGHYTDTKLITWDDATNQWTATASVPYSGSSGNIGHAYYHLAMNPTTGDMYLRGYGTTTIWKKPYGSTWTTATNSGSWDSYMQVAGGLEWFPALNSGSGGLVMLNNKECKVSNSSVTSWAYATGGGSSALSGAYDYHNWIAKTSSYCYMGGGNGSTAMYRLDASGTVAASTPTPYTAGIWANGGNAPVISHTNGTDLIQFPTTPTSGTIYKFNGSVWSSIGTMNVGTGYDQWFAVPVFEYGVVVFVALSTSLGEPIVRLFKP